MKDGKAQIRHEILNLLTTANMILEAPRIVRSNKIKLQKIVEMIGLLINHEELIGGEKVEFYKEKFNLNDLLDLVISINEDRLQINKVSFRLPNDELWIHTDKTVVKDFLNQLIAQLCQFASTITFSFKTSKNSLEIHYTGGKIFSLEERALLACLKDKKCLADELPIRIYMELLRLNGIRLKFNQKIITLIFPVSTK